tara:strand:+ start:370 stop:951 length:582 start_codon:yes stop_codon:yes gene_type:complete
MKLDKKFWDSRYLNSDIGWDLGGVSTPLKKYIDQLTNKDLKIIIPGCGNAHEAEYLFNNGFKNLILIDLSPTALNLFSKRVPEFPEDQLICEDFFKHTEKYDLMIEQTFFCAINPELRSKYAKHTSNILNFRGKLIGLLFGAELNNNKPPFGGNQKEYLNYFKPYFNINIMEIAYNSIETRKGRELFINLTKK